MKMRMIANGLLAALLSLALPLAASAQVYTDASLTGDGTSGNPLSVVPLFSDGSLAVQNASDPTKQFGWALGGQSTGATTTLAPLYSSSKTLNFQPLIDATGNVIVQNGTSGLILIGTSTALGGSNSGIQYSNLTANRAQIRLNAFGNHAGVSGMTCAKSRGTTIGDNEPVQVGDPVCRTTVQAGATTPGSLPISAEMTFQAAQVNSLTVALDWNLELTNRAGTLATRMYLTSEGALSVAGAVSAPSAAFTGQVQAQSLNMGPVPWYYCSGTGTWQDGLLYRGNTNALACVGGAWIQTDQSDQ